jgi:hypothetical protein
LGIKYRERQTIEPTGWESRQSDHGFLTSQAREILDYEGHHLHRPPATATGWNA